MFSITEYPMNTAYVLDDSVMDRVAKESMEQLDLSAESRTAIRAWMAAVGIPVKRGKLPDRVYYQWIDAHRSMGDNVVVGERLLDTYLAPPPRTPRLTRVVLVLCYQCAGVHEHEHGARAGERGRTDRTGHCYRRANANGGYQYTDAMPIGDFERRYLALITP